MTRFKEDQTPRILGTVYLTIVITPLLLLSMLFPSFPFDMKAYAANITLTWNRNTEPDIAGYKIFYGTQSKTYSNVITINDNAKEPSHCQYTIYGLQEGQTYYIALKALDLNGNTSSYSNEVIASIDANGQGDITNSVIINGSMEEGTDQPLAWRFGQWVPPGKSASTNPGEWSTSESLSGSHSLMLSNDTGTCLQWIGEEIKFDKPYPKTLTFGGWSKALNVSSSRGYYCLDFMVIFEDGSYDWYYKPLRFDNGTHDWQLKQVTKTWSKKVVAVRPYALLYYKTGTVWFDDIFVKTE